MRFVMTPLCVWRPSTLVHCNHKMILPEMKHGMMLDLVNSLERFEMLHAW